MTFIFWNYLLQVREICEAFRQLTDTELTEQVQKLLGEKDARPFNAYSKNHSGVEHLGLKSMWISIFCSTVEASDDPASFFANCLHNCFDGAGTDDQCLIRLIASRCEVGHKKDIIDPLNKTMLYERHTYLLLQCSQIDLADIAEAYEDFHGKSLTSKIKSETSGDYQNLLLGLLGYEK